MIYGSVLAAFVQRVFHAKPQSFAAARPRHAAFGEALQKARPGGRRLTDPSPTASSPAPPAPGVASGATAGPAAAAAHPAPPDVQARASAALQELWPLLVRRVAWEGDRRRACMTVEVGAGPLDGATVVLRYDEGRMRVAIGGPAGADLDAWRARIGARLVAAGLPVDEVE